MLSPVSAGLVSFPRNGGVMGVPSLPLILFMLSQVGGDVARTASCGRTGDLALWFVKVFSPVVDSVLRVVLLGLRVLLWFPMFDCFGLG